MYGLAIYSLKVGACLVGFYLFFKLLLSRETFHRFNRVVVLGAVLLSFVLPVCVITVTREAPVLPDLAAADIPVIYSESVSEPEAEPFPWETLIGVLYLSGACAMLVAAAVSVGQVLRLVRSGRRERLDGGIVLVRLQQHVTPFSWWRYIVISEADYAGCGDEIITHERAHLRLHHSWDLLATDLAGCLQWFNPAMWLLRRELRAIHEYEADEAVLDSGVDARQYQLMLIKKAAGGRWYSVANSFNHSKLKNRITMMLQKRSSRWAGAKALFVVPLAGLALGAFAETVYVLPQDKGTQENDAFQISEPQDASRITVRTATSDGKHFVIVGRDGDETVKPAPLYLVDGEAVDDLKQVDKKRIRSITVLKDSSCAEYVEKYGDKAKNGVFLITLKKEGEPDNAVPADAKNMDDVVVVGYGTAVKNGSVEWNSDEWKEKEKEFAKIGEYFRSDEWKAKQKQLEEGAAYFNSDEWKEQQKKFAKMGEYFQSDEWKAQQKQLEKLDSYFQSDEWKESRKRLSRIGSGVLSDARIFIDGREATEAELKALASNRIALINISKDKQSDSSVISTISVVTKGNPARIESSRGTIIHMPAPAVRGRVNGVKHDLGISGKNISISMSREKGVQEYTGNFRVTDLSRIPENAVIHLNGKPATRQQVMAAKKLRRAYYYTGESAVERVGSGYFLDCHTRK